MVSLKDFKQDVDAKERTVTDPDPIGGAAQAPSQDETGEDILR